MSKSKKNIGISLWKADWNPWIVFAIAFLLYANTLGHQYAFDDSIVITDNQFTQSGFSGIPTLLTSDFFEGIYGKQTELTGGRYRPLSLLTFAIEFQFFGLNPFVGHLVNVLLFAGLCFLFYRLLADWFPKKLQIAFVGAILFAVHPIHTEVVANIKSRDELLCGLFVLLCMRIFSRSKSDNSLPQMFLASFYFFLALMAKETAITFLPIIPAIAWVFRDSSWKDVLYDSVFLIAPFILYFLLRTSLVGMIGGDDSPDIMENPFVGVQGLVKYATISVILFKYFMLLWFPYPLSADYSHNQIPFVDFSDPIALLGLFLHLAILLYGLYALWNRQVLGLILIWYIAPLSIVSNLVFNIGAPMGERFLFMSSFGFCIGIAWGLSHFMINHHKEKMYLKNVPAFGAFALVILLAIGLSFDRNKDWYDNKTLFRTDVNTSDQSAKMQYYCANTYINEYLGTEETQRDPNLLNQAEFHLQKGMEIYPEFHYLTYNLGLINNYRDNGQEAKKYLERTLELKPQHMQSIRLLGTVNARLLNDLNQSIYYFELARDTYGDNSEPVLQGLGNVYAMAGRFPESIGSFEQLLATDPQSGRYHLNLAITYERMGDLVNAKQYYDRAFELDPSLKR